MKKEKIIAFILMSISCVLFLTAIILMLTNNHPEVIQDNKESDEIKDVVEDSTTSNEVDNSNNDNNDNKPSSEVTIPSSEPNESVPTETVPSPTPTPTPSVIAPVPNPNPSVPNSNEVKTEQQVISYFTTVENSISATSNQDDVNLRTKIKDGFISIVDFIFYDKEIKGYTFKELTTSAKLQVIKIALSIDYKIDSYFPNYKDVIKDKYTSIKGKLAVKYLEFTSNLCESVGENTCDQAKEDFNTMKTSFGFTWDFIKELASSGSSKVKEFYESWRDSE